MAVTGLGTFTGPCGATPVPIASVAKAMTAYLAEGAHAGAGEEGFTIMISQAGVAEFRMQLSRA